MRFSDATLMAFHDGELDAETTRLIELARRSDAQLNARLAGLEQLGDFVRVWAASQQAEPTLELTLRRLPPPRAAWATRAAVASMAAAVFGVTLLAGSLLPRPAGPSENALIARSAVAPELGLPPEPAVAVESVDFGAQSGEIFLVESAKSETMVVWLAEGPAPSATGTL